MVGCRCLQCVFVCLRYVVVVVLCVFVCWRFYVCLLCIGCYVCMCVCICV